ncbi:MAG: sigma-70 family RNA polymerase sigma factor [Propionibacterium sp.]|nr:sigma-70 family RNA polymerase sigma factor [Propionibacterium sp.]
MALTVEQIRELCAQRDLGVVAAAASTHPAAAALVKAVSPEQLQTLVADGMAARNTLVEAFAGLVRGVVKRTVEGGQHTGDYVQEGMVALVNAVDRYDPNRGSLAVYAYPRVKGAILSLLCTRGGEFHLNAHQARARELVRSTTGRLISAGLPADSSAVAEHLGKTEEWVQQYADYRRPASLGSFDLGELEIPDFKTQQAMDAVGVASVTKYLNMLSDSERTALQLLHGLAGDRHSLAGVSEAMGVPRRLAESYVASGHAHLGQLIKHFEQQLCEGQKATGAEEVSAKRVVPSLPVARPGEVKQPLCRRVT